MFALNIQNSVISFKDIKVEDLPLVLNWYNKVDDFKFATGIDTPITLISLRRKYAEVAICRDEFFVGIYTQNELKMIGILKGRLKYRNRDAVWISSIVIDPLSQKKGFGTMTINMLLDHLKLHYNVRFVYLAVIEENIQGTTFWVKNNFRELRKIENHLRLQDKNRNVIIMFKRI
jgi:ribosomal protein S18 acetylase RimI-like enzyme